MGWQKRADSAPSPSQARNSEPHSQARVNLAPPRFAAYGSLLSFFLLSCHDQSDALKAIAAQFKYSLVFFLLYLVLTLQLLESFRAFYYDSDPYSGHFSSVLHDSGLYT